MKKHNYLKFLGIGLGLLTLIIHFSLMVLGGEVFYSIYSKTIFPLIRNVYDYTFGFIPFPMVYILFFLLIVFIVWSCLMVRKNYRISKKTMPALFFISLNLLNFVGIIIFSFYFLWGFNYYRPSIDTELNFSSLKIDSTDLINEFGLITELLEKERDKISKDTQPINIDLTWNDLETAIRVQQKQLLKSWNQRADGRVRIRAIRPKGSLLIFSTAGIYLPFVCEGHVDPGIHELQYPFTIAHEMAHGHGYTDEGVCNFIGFLTCMTSTDPNIRYSGLLGYWRYLYYEIRSNHPSQLDSSEFKLSIGIKNDLIAIRNELNKYPDILPKLRNLIYDSYLKTHGVQSGLRSYNEIITQVIMWKKSDYAFDFDESKN